MGYEELRNAVVIQAVQDYAKMLRTCTQAKITDPNEYFKHNYRRKNGVDSIANIIANGIDAKNFLSDPERLSLYTEVDGGTLLRAAQVRANAKWTNSLMKTRNQTVITKEEKL